MRSVFDEIKPVMSLSPFATDTTVNGDAVDTLGFDSAMAVIQIGVFMTMDDGIIDAYLEESTDGLTGWTKIIGSDMETITTINKTGLIAIDGLRSPTRKRYLRIVLTVDGTQAVYSGEILLGRAAHDPVN